MNVRLNKYLPVLLIVVLAIVSRMPYMLAVDFMLDGDESIMGLMSKHFYEGRELPFYFYGQNYGFSFLEVLAISAGYAIVGISDYVVKLSVLLLWIVGCIYFYRSLLLISNGNKWLSLLVTCLLLFAPAWAMWSMKARGGYISAFLFSNIVLYLSLLNSKKRVLLRYVIIGLLLVFIYQMQPLWLPGVLPFVLYALRQQPLKKTLSIAAGVLIAVMFFQGIAISDGYWKPAVLGSFSMQKLPDIWKYLYANLHGYYYLKNILEVPTITVVFVCVFAVLLIASLLFACYSLLRNNRNKGLLISAVSSVLLTLSYSLFIDTGSPRYALPLTGFALILIGAVLVEVSHKRIVYLFMAVLVLIGAVSMFRFRDFRFHETGKRPMQQAIEEIKKAGVTHVYCTGPLMQWELAFYSKEDIIARYYYSADRYMPYINAVDSVYNASPQRTAIVGKYGGEIPEDAKEWINQEFFICRQPSQELLSIAGFQK